MRAWGWMIVACLGGPGPAGASEPRTGAADDDEAPAGGPVASDAAPTDDEDGLRLDWYDSHAHAVRLDVALGRWTGEDLGAGGLALQWEWWPTEHLSFATRTWLQSIQVPSQVDGGPVAAREATGTSIQAQVATPGPVKGLVGVGAGIAFVNGRLPPSDRWRTRPLGVAGVVEAHAGVVLLAAPVTVHALGWVHLYSEGPPVLSVGFGGGPVLRPGRGLERPEDR